VTSESNAMMYPLNDEKGEQMPVLAGGYNEVSGVKSIAVFLQ